MKEFFREIILYLIVIFNAKYWISNDFIHKDLDKTIRRKIKNKCPVKLIDNFTCDFDGSILWITNYPYAYGYKWIPNIPGVPSRRTRI